ncbi:MAG: type II toxin-antitoxin system VapC family toxin [Alphaproteobacteria bacterium]|nr:type II toxin-antitoxin system VapC family toxin [Alphaproteobacteria bacterium]
MQQDAAQLLISDWAVTEMSSAMAKAEDRADQPGAALAMFNKLVTESFTLLTVTGSHFRAAAKFADQHMLGLRAGDALHLATASEHGATVHTLDQKLPAAGPVLGVPTHLLA